MPVVTFSFIRILNGAEVDPGQELGPVEWGVADSQKVFEKALTMSNKGPFLKISDLTNLVLNLPPLLLVNASEPQARVSSCRPPFSSIQGELQQKICAQNYLTTLNYDCF
jgi:hypothetical protein